ncbi:MAG: hypothetical protein LBB07_00680 [Bifidobacteriaceae bacterium]|jgi:hypothetical protein|nr:hypothetical protein [Bifidobacteriaceae bacterium]
MKNKKMGVVVLILAFALLLFNGLSDTKNAAAASNFTNGKTSIRAMHKHGDSAGASSASSRISVDANAQNKSGKNAIYKISIVGLGSSLSADEIAFRGIFSNSKIDKIENYENGNLSILTISKPHSFNENRVGQILIRGKSYDIRDKYIYSPAASFQSAPDPGFMIKASHDMFKAWSDKAFFVEESSDFFKGLGALNGAFVTANIAITIISMFTEKDADPVLKALGEINQKLTSLNEKIDFTTSEIQNSIQRGTYANHLNQYTSRYSGIRNRWIDLDINKFNMQMKKLANSAGQKGDNPDYSKKEVMEKIYKFAEGQSGYIQLQSLNGYMKNIFSNTGSQTQGSLYTDFMNLMDMTDGTAIPLNSDYINADVYTIHRAFQSIAKDWAHETLDPRRMFVDATLKEVVEIATPLMFAINWDISSNESTIKINAAHLDEIYRADAGCKTGNCKDSDNFEAMRILLQEQDYSENAINLDKALLKNVNDKIAKLKTARETEEKKISDDFDQYNNKKIAHNYRVNQYFKREITHNVSDAEGKGFWDMNNNFRKFEENTLHLPSTTWNTAEYETMKYAAELRNNNNYNSLAYEINGFAIKKALSFSLWTPEYSKRILGGKHGFSNEQHFDLNGEVVMYAKQPISLTQETEIWGDVHYICSIYRSMIYWHMRTFPSLFEKA